VLTGATLFSLRTLVLYRATGDLDLLALEEPVPECAAAAFREICAVVVFDESC
jgi:hypothetical protein